MFTKSDLAVKSKASFSSSPSRYNYFDPKSGKLVSYLMELSTRPSRANEAKLALGAYYQSVGEYQQALQWYEKSDDIEARVQIRILSSTSNLRKLELNNVKNIARSKHPQAAEAMFELWVRYSRGRWGAECHAQEAFSWCEKAASAGYPSALHYLAWCYQTGSGVEQNVRKAISFYQQSIRSGYLESEANLACCFEVIGELEQAQLLLAQVAKKPDSGEFKFVSAEQKVYKKSLAQMTVDELKRVAQDKSKVKEHLELFLRFREGVRGAAQDEKQADFWCHEVIKILSKAHSNDHKHARIKLKEIIEKMTIRELQAAADMHHLISYELWIRFRDGVRGAPQNSKQAFAWCQRAVEDAKKAVIAKEAEVTEVVKKINVDGADEAIKIAEEFKSSQERRVKVAVAMLKEIKAAVPLKMDKVKAAEAGLAITKKAEEAALKKLKAAAVEKEIKIAKVDRENQVADVVRQEHALAVVDLNWCYQNEFHVIRDVSAEFKKAISHSKEHKEQKRERKRDVTFSTTLPTKEDRSSEVFAIACKLFLKEKNQESYLVSPRAYFRWAKKMAEEDNHHPAQFLLFQMYQAGFGVDRSRSQAVFWLRKAAENGNADAQHELGYYHEQRCESELAEKWYALAAAQNHAWAVVVAKPQPTLEEEKLSERGESFATAALRMEPEKVKRQGQSEVEDTTCQWSMCRIV